MEIEGKLQRLLEELEKQRERLDARERENRILREENALLKRGLFGRGTERIDPGQLALYEAGKLDLPEPATREEAGPRKQKAGHGRAPFAADLPRETIELDVPQVERSCDRCGKDLRRIGEEVTQRGHIVPARVVVRRYVRRSTAAPTGTPSRRRRSPTV